MFPGANPQRFLRVFTRNGKSLTISSFFSLFNFIVFFTFFSLFPFLFFSFFFRCRNSSKKKKVVNLVLENGQIEWSRVKPLFRHKSFLNLFFHLFSIFHPFSWVVLPSFSSSGWGCVSPVFCWVVFFFFSKKKKQTLFFTLFSFFFVKFIFYLWMMGKTDVTAGRATAARRGVGRVHLFDARISWLQQLCAECVMESRFRPGEHDEADLESKMIDSIVLSKGTHHRPPMSSMSWSSRMVAASFTVVAEAARDCRVSIWNVRNACKTNGWFRIFLGMVIAILMVLSGGPSGISISDDCSQQKETDKNAAWRRQMKRARRLCRIFQDPDYCVESWWNWCDLQKPETCRRWWNWCGLWAQDLQVLLVRRQRGQSCPCENLAKCCWDSSLSRSDEIFSFMTTEQIVCK